MILNAGSNIVAALCRNIFVLFFGLLGSSLAWSQETNVPTAGPAPGTSEELVVGDMAFQISSLRVSLPQVTGSSAGTTATVSMRARNLGQAPVALNVVKKTLSLVNDLGYTWPIGDFYSKVSGVGIASERSASTEYVVEPGKELRMQFQLPKNLAKGQTIGSVYDFSAEFAAYRDIGEGKLERVRTYSVSFVGLQRAGAVQGAADDLKKLGSDTKRALGSLLGR